MSASTKTRELNDMGKNWRFCQVFGDSSPVEEICEADVITTVEFDSTGNYIAAGDRGGRIVLFERLRTNPRQRASQMDVEYRFFTEFQSHSQDFDYLRSLEIDEKINKIRWLPSMNGDQFLLVTNDKTIKLWKVYSRKLKQVSSLNLDARINKPLQAIRHLRIPKLNDLETVIAANPRRIFANAHVYHINSLSTSFDGCSFLSSDDLRVNIWDINRNDTALNTVDIKPDSMDELSEVITTTEFHPRQCSAFVYSTSKGVLKWCDMRDNALCDTAAKTFVEPHDGANQNFYSEIVASTSDISFSQCGRYLLSRDFLTLKVWDVNMESRPLHTISIHDQLRPHLFKLYESDIIFDKFECSFSKDASLVLTGSYNNNFHVYNREGSSGMCIEATRVMPVPRRTPNGTARKGVRRAPGYSPGSQGQLDTSKKVLHLQFHPHQNVIAVATLSNLFIYALAPPVGR